VKGKRLKGHNQGLGGWKAGMLGGGVRKMGMAHSAEGIAYDAWMMMDMGYAP
jgi:hypothetical protein